MLSLVIPCYNEQEVLPQLFRRVCKAARTWNEPYEVILVDDGSTDRTWERIQQMHRRDPRFKGVRLARNFGQQVAVSAGLRHARGEAVMNLDADLQDPPEQLHRFIAKWREGYDVVYAVRTARRENLLKRLCYKAFYRLQGKLASVPIPLDSGDFGLMDRQVVDQLNAMPERNRVVRSLRSWVGFRQVGLPCQREARAAGKVKLSFGHLMHMANDSIFGFSAAPLRLATWFGLTAVGMGMVGLALLLLAGVFSGAASAPGWAPTVLAVLFVGGVQLLCLGILGEYLGRIYDEVKGRPLWTTQETVGLEAEIADRLKTAA